MGEPEVSDIMESGDWDLLFAGTEQAQHDDQPITPRSLTPPPPKPAAPRKRKGRPPPGTRRRGRPRIPDTPPAIHVEAPQVAPMPMTPIPPSPLQDLRPRFTLPDSLHTRARQLLSRFIQQPMDETRGFRLRWLPVLITSDFDTAVIYTILAMFAISTPRGRHSPKVDEDEVLSYHSKAVRHVRNRLSDPARRNSDTVVATIVGLATYSRLVEEHEVLQAHLQGLKELVETRRGGLEAMSSCLRTLTFFADTHGASMRDVRPMFAIPMDLLPGLDSFLPRRPVSDGVQSVMLTWLRRWPSRTPIAVILGDTARLSTWIAAQAGQKPDFYLPGNLSGHWLLPLIYRCLQLLPDSEREDVQFQSCEEDGWAFQEALRHALILYLNRSRRCFGAGVGCDTPRINRLKAILLDSCPPGGWDGLESLLVWIIVVAGMEAERVTDQICFATFLAAHPQLAHLSNMDIIGKLKAFIWVDKVFNHKLHRLMLQTASVRAYRQVDLEWRGQNG